MRILVSSVLVSLLWMACASSKQHTLEDLPKDQLLFSSGGGFTGEYNEYLLLENGQLFGRRYVSTKLPMRPYETLDAELAKELFQSYDRLGIDELGYDDPGNMTYTIHRITGSDTTGIIWGGYETQPEEGVRSYWRRLLTAVQDRAPTM